MKVLDYLKKKEIYEAQQPRLLKKRTNYYYLYHTKRASYSKIFSQLSIGETFYNACEEISNEEEASGYETGEYSMKIEPK